MNKKINNTYKELKTFLILWSTQSFSQLGSSMTAFALTLWLYEKTGSALQTALLSICSYAPYVIMSIFAGALSDRWNKKRTMLACDTAAALCTVLIFTLLRGNLLMPWHLYLLNGVNGLMNTVQQPASDVAMTLIIPKKHYQRTSGLRSFSQSVITILNPVLATALFTLLGMNAVIAVDLGSFVIAFLALLFMIDVPQTNGSRTEKRESLFAAAGKGLAFLRENGLILVVVTGMKRPKNRIRIIYITMLISLSFENFLLAFTRVPALWCLGQLMGWLPVPIMNANMDVILRTTIPVELQGRVYSCRNTLQFFTIPVGFFLGGYLVDKVCEPLMEKAVPGGILNRLFGAGKGSGAAMVLFLLGILGVVICLVFGRILKKYRYEETL